jgi:iron only hydrogenase large subunit-like protein
MEEEFYATIKLLSGEEIVSKICYLKDENKILLEKPLQVEEARQKKGNIEVTGFSLKEWINATFEEMFVIDKHNCLTIIEVDQTIQSFYEKTLEKIALHKKYSTSKGKKLPRNSGYLGSIEEKKKSLEDIFNKS